MYVDDKPLVNRIVAGDDTVVGCIVVAGVVDDDSSANIDEVTSVDGIEAAVVAVTDELVVAVDDDGRVSFVDDDELGVASVLDDPTVPLVVDIEPTVVARVKAVVVVVGSEVVGAVVIVNEVRNVVVVGDFDVNDDFDIVVADDFDPNADVVDVFVDVGVLVPETGTVEVIVVGFRVVVYGQYGLLSSQVQFLQVGVLYTAEKSK